MNAKRPSTGRSESVASTRWEGWAAGVPESSFSPYGVDGENLSVENRSLADRIKSLLEIKHRFNSAPQTTFITEFRRENFITDNNSRWNLKSLTYHCQWIGLKTKFFKKIKLNFYSKEKHILIKWLVNSKLWSRFILAILKEMVR